MSPLETYLTELREIRDSGAATKETSGYGALAKLLEAVGQQHGLLAERAGEGLAKADSRWAVALVR